MAEPPSGQATIAAAIVEAAAATDATTGLSIVAMIEAATAASTVDVVSLIYSVAIAEEVTASDVAAVAGPSVAGTVTETAVAADTLDSSIVAVVPVQSMVAGTTPVFASVLPGAGAMVAPGVFVSG